MQEYRIKFTLMRVERRGVDADPGDRRAGLTFLPWLAFLDCLLTSPC